MSQPYTLEDAKFDIALLREDMRLIKWALPLGLALIVALHFVDPCWQWWIFQFP
jgi:hypothetical protein